MKGWINKQWQEFHFFNFNFFLSLFFFHNLLFYPFMSGILGLQEQAVHSGLNCGSLFNMAIHRTEHCGEMWVKNKHNVIQACHMTIVDSLKSFFRFFSMICLGYINEHRGSWYKLEAQFFFKQEEWFSHYNSSNTGTLCAHISFETFLIKIKNIIFSFLY